MTFAHGAWRSPLHNVHARVFAHHEQAPTGSWRVDHEVPEAACGAHLHGLLQRRVAQNNSVIQTHGVRRATRARARYTARPVHNACSLPYRCECTSSYTTILFGTRGNAPDACVCVLVRCIPAFPRLRVAVARTSVHRTLLAPARPSPDPRPETSCAMAPTT